MKAWSTLAKPRGSAGSTSGGAGTATAGFCRALAAATGSAGSAFLGWLDWLRLLDRLGLFRKLGDFDRLADRWSGGAAGLAATLVGSARSAAGESAGTTGPGRGSAWEPAGRRRRSQSGTREGVAANRFQDFVFAESEIWPLEARRFSCRLVASMSLASVG